MADRHRIGTFTAGGRFVTSLDLAPASATIAIIRDTFQITPPAKQPISAVNSRRYGGSRLVGESHANGSLSAEFYLRGGSHDASLALFDQITAILESSTTQYFWEWRPDGASRSTYFEIRATSWEPMYRWVEFSAAAHLHVKIGVQVAPLALGDPLDVYDDFSADSIADYTFDTGTGTLSASGTLTPSDITEKRFYHSARGYTYGDTQASLKITTGASVVAPWEHGLVLKRIDGSNFLLVRVLDTNNIQILKVDAGVYTTLGAAAVTATLASTSYWLVARIAGNVVTAELWTAENTPGGTPATTLSYTLAGAEATKFGTGIKGNVGARLQPKATDWRYDDFRIEPYTYANLTLPTTIDLTSIPGSAPALVDYYITTGAAAITPAWGALGWAQKIHSTPLLTVVEGEAMTGTNMTNAAVADARGGNVIRSDNARTTFSASTTIVPTRAVADAYSTDVEVEVWALLTYNAALTSVNVVTHASGSSTPRYTSEYGTSGVNLVMPSSGAVRRIVRLGSIPIPIADGSGGIVVSFTTGAATNTGSSIVVEIDWLALLPARARASSPTGKANDAGYPVFGGTASNIQRLIRSNLSGRKRNGLGGFWYDTHGWGGQQIVFPPGDVRAIPMLAEVVPGDPTSNTATEADGTTVAEEIRFGIWPRYHLTRSS